ncbi:MAG: ArsR family transcriptional regulator [Reyranella sp.]|nr:ArsR family transcriptional regulator [Reyranella sp.]
MLGEPSCLRILLTCLAEPASVSETALRAGIPRSLTSRHLRILRPSRLPNAKRPKIARSSRSLARAVPINSDARGE